MALSKLVFAIFCVVFTQVVHRPGGTRNPVTISNNLATMRTHPGPVTGAEEIVFPSTLNLEIDILQERKVPINAAKMTRSRKNVPVVDSKGFSLLSTEEQEVAYYADDNGAFCLTPKQNDDGSFTTDFYGLVYPSPIRQCWISDGYSNCWDVKLEDGKTVGLPYNDGLEVPQTNTTRKKRSGPTYEDFGPNKVIEILYMVDKPLVTWFVTTLNGGNSIAGIAEMKTYITLLNNALTHVYTNVKEVSNGDLAIETYAAAVLYPELGTDWSWQQKWLVYDYYFVAVADDIGYVGGLYDLGTWITQGNLDDIGYQWDLVSMVSGLGARHDGDDNSCSPDTHLMAQFYIYPNSGLKDTFMKFTTCSVNYFKSHLRGKTCLADADETKFLDNLCLGFRGDEFDIDAQCQQYTGTTTSTMCYSDGASNGKVSSTSCWDDNRIQCTNSAGNCVYYLPFVAYGTSCEGSVSSQEYVCYRENCIEKFDLCAGRTTPTTSSSTSSSSSSSTSPMTPTTSSSTSSLSSSTSSSTSPMTPTTSSSTSSSSSSTSSSTSSPIPSSPAPSCVCNPDKWTRKQKARCCRRRKNADKSCCVGCKRKARKQCKIA